MKKILIILLVMYSTAGYTQNWEKINTGFNYIFKGIEFPGGQSQIGWAGGQSLTYMGDGIVLKTINGGSTWTSLWTGIDQGVEGISFPDMNTGYIGGWSAYFAKTTNGGMNWTPQNPGTDIYYYTDVVFKDATHGIVTASTNSSGGGVYFTSDGGTTWNTGTGLTGVPYKACYVSENTYYLVTNGGNIQKTMDGGSTWTIAYAAGGLLLGIDFYSPMIGIAAGEDGRILKTYDGGSTWQQQITAFGNPLWHDFAWAGQNEVYSVGTPETIYKSLDGGASWTDDYPQTTYNPALYEVLVTTDGIVYVCGSQGWFYRKSPELTATFIADNTTICSGGSVQFTDQSVGSVTGWAWTFEGGTPATSTQHNPLVTYSAPGIYDVTLTVSMGTFTDTKLNPDMIHVEVPVSIAPLQPTGPESICGSFNYEYNTTSVPEATSYIWATTPGTAGTFSGNGLTGTLSASNTWDGSFTVKVSGSNACGTGPASSELNCILYHQPNAFSLFAGGGYCEGQPGYEIKLEDSDLGVDYQLFKDGTAIGTLVPGTGNLLSFGFQPVGTYTVTGYNQSCVADMNGAPSVYLIDPPAVASQPTGPASSCNDTPSTYTAILPANGYSLLWTLAPAEAGTISQPTTTTANVVWNTGFSGAVTLSVQGTNECGNGPSSPALNISIHIVPTPLVTGLASVCKDQEITYEVTQNAGSSYVWSVTGGTITMGQSSNVVKILWVSAGNGSVSVTETSAENCQGTSPLYPVLVSECTGIIEKKSDNVCTVFPNPVVEVLYVEFPTELESDVTITIYNQTGQNIFRETDYKTDTPKTLKIDVSSLNTGIYNLNIISNSMLINKPFVKK